ncbi:MAG TPA: response regulator transcription factor [Halomonas sp.]|nr:response regulator transcription factor [Halomonas sp.]
MPSDKVRVLVIDDEPHIRHFLRISLTSQGFQVIEAASGHEGLDKLYADTLTSNADIVLLDLGLPDMDGQQVLNAIRQRSEIPVIIVSVRGHEAEKVRALDNGASDYVTKPFGIQELLARIRALLRRRASPSTQRYQHGGLIVDLTAYQVNLNNEPVHLTPKEFAVLAQLIASAGRVVTQTQLLRQVWGPTHKEDTHYLRIVVSKLRQKLGDDPQSPTLLQTEPGIGYRLALESDREDKLV